jgi:hypothetical protein
MGNLELTALPESFPAGTTVIYTKSFTGFSSAEWTLKLYLAGASVINVTAAAEGTGFKVTLAAGDTDDFPAGTYQWTERLEKTGAVCDIASGTVILTPNLATATAGSLQSWAERVLPLVEAAIAGRIPSGMESYQIAGRAVSKIPIPELKAFRSSLLVEISRLKHPKRISRPIYIKFPPTGA